MALSSQEARHLFGFAVHFSAFWFLLGFALSEDPGLSVYGDQFWWEPKKFGLAPRRWYYQCVDSTGQLNATLLDCDADDKRFYVRTPAASTVRVNILVLACLYVFWSAAGHLASVFVVARQRELRWLDYAVTAPTMLVVLSLAFGADSATAIVIAPSVLAALLVLAGILERRESEPDGAASMSYYRLCSIAVLFLSYVPVMLPALYASYDITVDHEPGTGTAPNFVFAFAVTVALLFTSFAAVYAYDLMRPLDFDSRERWYLYLSMVAKTSLHLFLGLAVIGQSNNVGVDTPSPEEDDMDTLAIGLGGVAALVIGLGGINKFFDRLFGYAPVTKYSELRDKWITSFIYPSQELAESDTGDDGAGTTIGLA